MAKNIIASPIKDAGKPARSLLEDSPELRNFLFFINEVYPLNNVNSLSNALVSPSSWDTVAGLIKKARQENAFVRSIKNLHLYVHVPFCQRLCTFCHCPRVLLGERSEIDTYIKALIDQMMFWAPVYKGMSAPSICFGGGSPSILNEKELAAILDGADKAFPARGRKIIFEANPSSWTEAKLKLLSSRGLSRLSIGIQSLDEDVLKRVSRPQTKRKVLWCLRSAKKAGIPHVNVDFIAGLPGQTLKSLVEDLKIVIREGANSVSVEPYTVLSLKELCGPGETVPVFLKRRDALMQATAMTLQKAGFRHTGLLGTYTLQGKHDGSHQEEAYSRLEEAVAGFGPMAKGQFPGAIYYRAGTFKPGADLPVVAALQDKGYAMSHYALIAVIYGLDEKVFFKRFGVSLDRHCGEGLRYLQEAGLVGFSGGVWKFSGQWELSRIREFVVLSRVLFGEEYLLSLRKQTLGRYDPRHDYSRGNSLLKAYTDDFLMALYYRGKIY